MSDIDKAVELARRCLDLYDPESHAHTLARAVLAMADVAQAARWYATAEGNEINAAESALLGAAKALDAEARRG